MKNIFFVTLGMKRVEERLRLCFFRDESCCNYFWRDEVDINVKVY